MNGAADRVKHVATKRCGMSLVERVAKLFEEGGELARAALLAERVCGKYRGISAEVAREQVIDEAADVVICALACAFRAVPNLSVAEVVIRMHAKLGKWERALAGERRP